MANITVWTLTEAFSKREKPAVSEVLGPPRCPHRACSRSRVPTPLRARVSSSSHYTPSELKLLLNFTCRKAVSVALRFGSARLKFVSKFVVISFRFVFLWFRCKCSSCRFRFVFVYVISFVFVSVWCAFGVLWFVPVRFRCRFTKRGAADTEGAPRQSLVIFWVGLG